MIFRKALDDPGGAHDARLWFSGPMTPREAHTYRTEAIVLGHIEYGEADQILKLFTQEKGKITAIAKGIRKIRSRKAGHLEPFSHVNIFLARGHSMDIVTQVETVEAFTGLRDDLRRVAMASYVIELLDRFTWEEGQNRGLFRLLAQTLARLSDHPGPELVVHYYEIRLLELLGFRPQLFDCIDCGKPIEDQDQYFSPLVGGVVCPGCGRSRTEAWVIDRGVLRYLRHLQRSNWQKVLSVSIPPDIEPKLGDLMERYFSYLLERKLNAPDFLRKVQ